MSNGVIGQTGKVILSDDIVVRRYDTARVVRFQYTKIGNHYRAYVCGPSIHSPLYGLCSFGVSKESARKHLQSRLIDNGFYGKIKLSDEDAADK